nr:MAG TPA: hypothetical protein [Caudoviricetes sp.]
MHVPLYSITLAVQLETKNIQKNKDYERANSKHSQRERNKNL